MKDSSEPTRRTRPSLLTVLRRLALASAGASLPVAAQGIVTSPTGATLPSGAPVLVQWSPSAWASSVVGITLYGNQGPPTPVPGAIIAPLATNLPNNGQAYVNLPTTLACDPSYVYQVAVWADIQVPVTGRHFVFSKNFKLTCASASLTVAKTVVVNGAPTASSSQSFSVGVTCTPGGPNTSVALNSSNAFQRTITQIPANSNCTISETAPPAAVGCHWQITYPLGSGAIVTSNAVYKREVRNELKCKTGPATAAGNLGATAAAFERTGSITVVKKVFNHSQSAPPPSISFPVAVACTPSGPSTTVALSIANSFKQAVGSIPAGSNCTIVEQLPALTPDLERAGCRWTTNYVDGRAASIGSPATAVTLTIENHWWCR